MGSVFGEARYRGIAYGWRVVFGIVVLFVSSAWVGGAFCGEFSVVRYSSLERWFLRVFVFSLGWVVES